MGNQHQNTTTDEVEVDNREALAVIRDALRGDEVDEDAVIIINGRLFRLGEIL